MEKRYQVFISSTFKDLVIERQDVLKAVLEINQMPAGMELFPATDDSSWQLIKDVIDGSDYYVLIIGGRYGSLDETGISYTEKEYEYAYTKRKPVIPFLHQNPDNLPRGRTDTDKETWKKLKEFRSKIEKRHTCKYWDSVEDLKAKVIVGLTATIKNHPAIGWIRADEVPDEATLAGLLSARQKISELESELKQARISPPQGSEDLRQGDDPFEVQFSFTAYMSSTYFDDPISYKATIFPSWNDIFAGVAPLLINDAKEQTLRSAFRKFFTQFAEAAYRDRKEFKDRLFKDFCFADNTIDTCLIQLRALGLITESMKKRSITDTSSYWTITPYGDKVMVQLLALRRMPAEARKRSGKAEKQEQQNAA